MLNHLGCEATGEEHLTVVSDKTLLRNTVPEHFNMKSRPSWDIQSAVGLLNKEFNRLIKTSAKVVKTTPGLACTQEWYDYWRDVGMFDVKNGVKNDYEELK